MTFVVAEVGSNWTCIDDCMDSISMAKSCGAAAVKFQMFTDEDLYGPIFERISIAEDGRREIPPRKWVTEFSTWFPKLKAKADAVGIEFMCTAFSEEGVDYVDQFVTRHKIASAELSHKALLERVRGKNKPILLSTGASSLTDVRLALQVLDGADVTLLYCVSAYPARDVNLWGMELLRQSFPGLKIGYSCHTADISASVIAAKYHGAEVIEKHFKLRDMDTPDNPHSIGPQRFKWMVKMIRGNPADLVMFPDPQEDEMLTTHNRRLIVTAEVKVGDAFVYGKNFGIYRAQEPDNRALSGFAYDVINGKTATKDIGPGDGIGPGDFK